jgi:hypothetical protein
VLLRKRYNHKLDKEFNNPNALNFSKTSRLRYAGHRIIRPVDLPQKALFRAKPKGRRNQGRPKSKWADRVDSDGLALCSRQAVMHSKKSRVDSTRSAVGFVCHRCVSIRSTRKRVESTRDFLLCGEIFFNSP